MVVYGSVHILPYDPQCHELFAICCLLFDAICYFYVLTVLIIQCTIFIIFNVRTTISNIV